MEEENLSKMLGSFVENHRFVCLCINPMIKKIMSLMKPFLEQKVMPFVVLASFLVYFVVAGMFYYF